MPYRVITNSQGLRKKADVIFPKSNEKTRILFIGDSFTFGPYLDNHDGYPQLVEQKTENIEAINAGIAGYTVCDEYSYFADRGKYIEPDIVVLQVVDNDLYGFFPHKQKAFCRGGEFCIEERGRLLW
jgi:lysophospholipase L1-like esterase